MDNKERHSLAVRWNVLRKLKMNREQYNEEEWEYMCERFADPGGDSALHAETDRNPRNIPCPTCKQPDRLTRLDRSKGYQCDPR